MKEDVTKLFFYNFLLKKKILKLTYQTTKVTLSVSRPPSQQTALRSLMAILRIIILLLKNIFKYFIIVCEDREKSEFSLPHLFLCLHI